ncbi:hypothetical protein JCM10296v2_004771 [Rhodotorula toruloides]
MHRPLPELLETFPGFRDAYDKYCVAPWSCYCAIERELIPRMMEAYSKSRMSDDFKTGVQALVDCMKFATVAAEHADEGDSIDQYGTSEHGIILSYEEFDVSYSYEEFDVSYSYSPSDDLICSVIGHAKCAIYTHPDLVNSYYGPVALHKTSPPPNDAASHLQ